MKTNPAGLIVKRINSKALSVLVAVSLIVNKTAVALAVQDPAITNGDAGSGLFNKFIIPFSNFLAGAVGLIVVISIIYGAIEYSSAGGDPNKAAKARGRIQKAIVSLIVFFFLYAILQWIVPGGIGG